MKMYSLLVFHHQIISQKILLKIDATQVVGELQNMVQCNYYTQAITKLGGGGVGGKRQKFEAKPYL